MASRIGTHTIALTREVFLHEGAGIAGKTEKEGPLGNFFDIAFDNDRLGQETWEKAESSLQTVAVRTLLGKVSLQPEDIQVIFAGDLLNQCISSTFGLRELQIPLMGQYGACSTMAQALAVGAVFVDSGAAERAVAVTSSHFCSAERQFRMPLEYGGQRTPTAQRTVTGAGAALLDKSGQGPVIRHLTIGTITDLVIKDANHMGAAMAPAAADTLLHFLSDTHSTVPDYDLILTGDLGSVGSSIFRELLAEQGVTVGQVHQDCGCLIYDREKQDVYAGGSGCGCSASVFCSYILQRMKRQELHSVLFMATGALMSPTSSQQGESIPGIAHLVHLQQPERLS